MCYAWLILSAFYLHLPARLASLIKDMKPSPYAAMHYEQIFATVLFDLCSFLVIEKRSSLNIMDGAFTIQVAA